MSQTISAVPTTAPPPVPLISSSPANQSTATAASGSAAGVVIILLWLLGLFHVTVPPEVSAAFVTLIGAGVHWVMIKYGISTAS